jgi:sugar lactone lactonase YvrE/subtilisin-like proprotein convertase family protein
MHITAGNCPGAGWMDYSTDCGNTWQKLGAYTDNPDGTQEWYNQYEHDIAPDGVCWWGIKSTYSQVIYNLSEYAGNSNISFRFVLMVQGNWSGGYDSDGWSIDDFEIEHQTNAPTILPLIQDQTINEDSSFTPITLDNHVSDTNHLASEITWSTSVSDHLSVNIDTSRIATISINAPDWYGVESIIFTATDPEGMTDTDLVVFTVISVNDPPTIANAIPDQTADQDVPFSFTFGSNIFEDVDAGDNLTYTATLNDGNPLPSWLTFNSFTRTFNGTPTNNDGGTITIIVTAEDSFSESVSDAFDLTVSNATSKYWLSYVISDSLASYNSNTWTENNWTEINVSNDHPINDWSIEYTWSADNYPEEASFFVLSPSDTQYTIASAQTSGTYTVTTSKFVGEPANGQWRLWIEDSYGDGGCGASNINMSIEFLGSSLTVTLPESTDEGIGSITGTVTASSIPEENLTVYLYSNNPGRLTVASETIILAGEDHADFTISIIDDLLLNGSSDVQVMASASEYYTGTGILQVNDNESTVLSIVLPYSANEYEQYIQGAFIVDQAVDCDVDIPLISSEPNILSVQEMVMIPSGLTEVTFQLTIHNFTVAQAISITATVANWIINDDTINLIPSMISELQRQALIDLYNSTDGSSWYNSNNWLGERGTECSWYGVTCDDYESNVIRIGLDGNNLIGDIPGSISNLQDLSGLWLSGNQLSSLPESFGNLQYLSELYLYDNQLSRLSESFGNLQNLLLLGLSGNQLSSLPESFENLQNLSTLYLQENQLSSLPDSFGNLQYLSELYLYDNQLSSLPESFGNLQYLSYLYLQENQLSSLPESFGNLQNLFDLDLSNNPPSIDTISNQLTSENMAIHSISMTVSDLNYSSCNMTLNMISSNPSLIPNEYILYECQQNQYTMVVMPAFNQTGTTEISLTIVNGYDLAATTAFQITVNDVDESRYQWGNFQAAESILGQSDFSSNLSGTTTSNFSFPNHIAVDPTTGNVFVSEDQNHRILRFSSTASLINGSSAEAVFGQADFVSGSSNRSGSPDANTLANPSGIFVDAFGHLWVADSNNHRVLKFDHAASKINGANADAVFGQADFISNASQTSQNQMDHPQSVWVDPAGRLWVADYNNNRVLRFDHAASKTNGANADGVLGQSDYTSNTSGTTQSLMNGPSFVSGNNAGTLFVCSTLSHRVLRFDNAASKTNGANADGVLGQTDFTSDTSDTTSNHMNEPTGIALDYVGHLYVSDKGNNRVLIFQDVVNKLNGDDADYVLGQSDFISNTPNNGGISEKTFNMPNGLFFDNENCYLWTADSQNHRVLRYLMARSTTTQISFTIPDSPASYTSNTWTENNWTEINVSNDQIIINWSIAYVWSADNYPEEASFLVLSPSGTQYIIASGETSGTYTKTINSFNGEPASGQWRLWIEDSYGDGGCQALTLTMSIETTDSLPQISSISSVNTLESLSASLTFSLTDAFDGIISLTPYSSDNNLVSSENILLTHASMMHESDNYTLLVTAGIPETITLSIIPADHLNGNTQIDIIISNAYNLTALTSFTLTVIDAVARSMKFDGMDDHIISNTDISIVPTNAISIEAWIYLYTNTTDMAILTCGNDTHQSITFEHHSHNMSMRLRNASNMDIIELRDISASPLPINQWHHVCAVWDNTTNTGKLYANGQCFYHATFASDTIGYGGERKLFLGSWFGQQQWFNGRMDDIRFWRTALLEQTIQEWRFRSVLNEHPDYDQLIACYPFNTVDGTLVFDMKGKHHGYLYNNTTVAAGPTRQIWIPFNRWLNTNNNNWNNPMNWEAEFVPNRTNPGFVFIDAGMRKPVLSAPSSINNLVLDKGASYQASNVNSLNIFGKFYNEMNTVKIDIGSSLTVFSSMDFKTDRIAPVVENQSLSITTNASENIIQWEQATDDQTPASNLEYAVIMSHYSQTCLEQLGEIAANISSCEIETMIPFQTVSSSGSGETVRSGADNFAKVSISGLSGGTHYFNVLVRDEMNNLTVYGALSFNSKGVVSESVLFESDSLSGISKAIVFNDQIALLITENAGQPSGYPDPRDHSNLYLLLENITIAVDDSGRVDCAFSTDLALRTDNKIAIAYQKWAGSGYSFDSPYKVYDGSAFVVDQLIFDDQNWGYYTSLGVNSTDNAAHVIQFSHSGYYLNYSTDESGSWTNSNMSGSGTYYHYPTLTVDNEGIPHVLTSQLSNNDGTLQHWFINSTDAWESETIASDSNGHGNIVFNSQNVLYGIYVNQTGELRLIVKENDNWQSELIDTGLSESCRTQSVNISPTGEIYSIIQTSTEIFAYKKGDANWEKIEVCSNVSLITDYRYGSKSPTILFRNDDIIAVYADKSRIYATSIMFH